MSHQYGPYYRPIWAILPTNMGHITDPPPPLPKGGEPKGKPTPYPIPEQGSPTRSLSPREGSLKALHKAYKTYKSYKSYMTYKP